MNRRILVSAALVGATLSMLPAASPSQAAPNVVASVVGNTYSPRNVTIVQGTGLTYANAHISPHNLVSAQTGPNGPLFGSTNVIPTGGTTAVAGVDTLAPGTYGFVCTLHQPGMVGTLTVAPAPAAAALPPVVVPSVGAVATPTSLTVHGTDMYVASLGQGAVLRLPILPGGVLGPAVPYATGFSSPLGVVFGPDGTLFVSDSHSSATPGRSTAGRVWAIAPGGGSTATAGSVVIDELPNGRHNTNGMAVHNGRLYITNGNSTDDGVTGGDPEQPLSGTLLSVALSARGLTPADTSEYAVEATGMRNVYDVAFRAGTDEAWLPTNGPDFVEPWGEDTLVKATVTGSAPNFGFPSCLHRWDGATILTGQNPTPGVGACDFAGHTMPETMFGLHPSADGVAFGPADAFWGGDLFVAEFGNFFGDEIVGHKVVRVPIDANGVAGRPQDFFVGPAPLDVAFGPDGLYVADFGTGQITLLKAPPA